MTLTLREVDFLAQVSELAELRGWRWVHFRPAQTSKGWRTAVQGPLGKGWPDLLLVRGERLIFAELKRDGLKATPEQMDVLDALFQVGETYCWHPVEWDEIEETLR